MTVNTLKAGILVVSETASKDPSTDKAVGPLGGVFLNAAGQWGLVTPKFVPDNVQDIQRIVTRWCDRGDDFVNVVVTTGGTGFAEKDVTPEAIKPLLHREAPGLVHGMLAKSLEVTPFAMMARPVAGVRNKTIIITLPGSPKGARENLEAIIKLLPHACMQAAGMDNSREVHAGGTDKLEREAGIEKKSESNTTSGHGAGSHSHHHHGLLSHSHSHQHGKEGHVPPVPHTDPSNRPQPNDPQAGPSRRNRSSPYPMLDVPKALELISDKVAGPQKLTRDVNSSLIGAVLAANAVAAESVPAFRASIVDGYAVRMYDEKGEKISTKGKFPMNFVSHAQAGKDMRKLQVGEIARVTTGAPIPPGADAVVMVEDTVLSKATDDGKEEAEIEILTDDIKDGENVREAGSDVKKGDIVLREGEGISAIGGEFGLLASVGLEQIETYSRPIVGVMSTGDEIIEHTQKGDLKMGEVRDTNRPTLLTAARGCGFDVVDLGIVADKASDLEASLRSALASVDVLITSGGVSMGELDLLKPTVERSLGGTVHFGRVSMKPGKPTTFATVPAENIKDPKTGERGIGSGADKVIFSLPGNPASAIVTFMLFVLPALHKMSGVAPVGLPRVMVKLESDVHCDKVREEYHRVTVFSKPGEAVLYANSTGGQRSSRVGSFKGANALLRLEAGGGTKRKGEQIEALLMSNISSSGQLV